MYNKQSTSSRLSGRLVQQASSRLLKGAAVALVMSSTAIAGNSPWYVAPQLGAVTPDNERGDFDNGTLVAFSVGRELGEQWAAELRAATFSLNGTVDDRNTDQMSLGLDVHWYPFGRLLDDAILRPYLLAGVAFVDTDIGDNFSSENAATSIGLGASLRLFDTGLALRGESRYVTDFVDANDADNYSDWQSTLGVQIPIGSQRETGASPVVQPAPAKRKPVSAIAPQAKSAPPARTSPKTKQKPAKQPFSPFTQPAPTSDTAAVSKPATPPPEPAVVEAEPRKPFVKKPPQSAPKKPTVAAKPAPKPKAAAPAPVPAKAISPKPTAARQPAPANSSLLSSSTTDSDGDGIRNSVDLCAATPSGGYVDADGCPLEFGGKQAVAAALQPKTAPKPVQAAKPTITKPAITPPKATVAAEPTKEKARSATTIPLKGVSFASGSAELTTGSSKAIARVAGLMMKKPDLQVEIAGHTDNKGDKAANLELSELRAQAVKNALIAQGISFRRISTKGYGDTKPVASNETEAGMKENRRIELKLLR